MEVGRVSKFEFKIIKSGNMTTLEIREDDLDVKLQCGNWDVDTHTTISKKIGEEKDAYLVKLMAAEWECRGGTGAEQANILVLYRGIRLDEVDAKVWLKWGQNGLGVKLGRFKEVVLAAKDNCILAWNGEEKFIKFVELGRVWWIWKPENPRTNVLAAVINPDKVYITVSDNRVVVLRRMDGKKLHQWGRKGSGEGEFDFPGDLDVSGTCLLIVDRCNERVQIFDSRGTYLGQWGFRGRIEEGFLCPLSISAGPNGVVYIADKGNDCVKVFTREGVVVRTWRLNRVLGVCVGGNRVYASEWNNCMNAFTLEGCAVGCWRCQHPSRVVMGETQVYVRNLVSSVTEVFLGC